MTIMTLADVQKLGTDDQTKAGIAETIITANPIFTRLPFNLTYGNAYAFVREGAGATVIAGGRGQSTASASGAPAFDKITLGLTTIIGDAEIAGIDIAQGIGSNAGNNVVDLQIAAKAKAIGREYQRMLVAGDAAAPGVNVTGVTNDGEFSGLIKLIGSDAAFAAQKLDKANAALTLDMLDELIFAVTSGDAEFIMANGLAVRKILSLLRAAGGVTMTEQNGIQVPAWNGVPIYRNDYIGTDFVGGTAGNQTHVIAGTFDDGSRTKGLAGVTPADGGVSMTPLGESQTADVTKFRVKMYATAAVHSTKAIAGLWNVTV